MTDFSESYLGRLRQAVGSRLLLVPGARIVVEDAHGRVLLQHRADFRIWGLPGGGAEEGEDIQTTIVRELLEETGVTAHDIQPFGFGCDPAFETLTFSNGDRSQCFVMMFFTRHYSGTPHPVDGESLALDWFDPAALPDTLGSTRRSLEAYARFQRTGAFQII